MNVILTHLYFEQTVNKNPLEQDSMNNNKKKVALVILDGWGHRIAHTGNAIILANTPNIDFWLSKVESSVIDASGEAVGLSPNQMGNSEVGH